MNATSSNCLLVYKANISSDTVCGREGGVFKPIVDDHTVFVFQVVVNVFANGMISILGIVANVLNIIVFIRQGIFTESGTAGIFGLAVSDLCCVFSMFWLCIIEAVVLAKPTNLSWDPSAVKTATAFWVHMMFANITRVVTVYIAFERCVCVMFPFKVKTLLNPKRGLIIMTLASIMVGLCFAPHFIAFQLGFVTDAITNITRLVLVTNVKFQSIALDKMIYASGYATNIFSVVSVFVCTLITASRIHLSKTWRESMSAGTSGNSKSETTSSKSKQGADKTKTNVGRDSMSKSKMQKEARLVRMIIIISVVFLLCYTPLLIYLIMITANKQLGLRGKYKNFSRVMYTLTFLMGTVNSSINTIIYYTMSTRYREVVRSLFGLKTA